MNERKDNLQKASSGGWVALRLTLTMTGLSFAGFGGAEELSPSLVAIKTNKQHSQNLIQGFWVSSFIDLQLGSFREITSKFHAFYYIDPICFTEERDQNAINNLI